MKDLMIQLVNASFQGGVIIAVIFALRFVLKKTPKSILCLLWMLAIARLLLPIQLESSLSLQPDVSVITQQESQQPGVIIEMPKLPAHVAPSTSTTIQTDDGQLLHVELTYANEAVVPEQSVTIDWAGLLPWLWLAVAAGLALWSILSYWKLRGKTQSAVILRDRVWLSPELDSAFVLGYLKPQIYLPAKLAAEERQLVISHEQAHIRRFDHWYKLLGFITLCIHWFNPLVWLAYIFLCRDMEMACDEQVVRDMDTQQRKAYSMALLRCSADNHHFKPCPVAFAEVSVKDRIKGVLNYKKPGFWMTLVGIVAVVFVAVCFLTSPATKDDPIGNMPGETTQAPLTDYSEQELRQHCIDLMKQLRAEEYRYLSFTVAFSDPEHNDEYIRQIEMPGFYFLEERLYEDGAQEPHYQLARIAAQDGEECYEREILNPGDTWVQKANHEMKWSMFIPEYLNDDPADFKHYPMEICEFEDSIWCVFDATDDVNVKKNIEFHFDTNGKPASIVIRDSSSYGESVRTYDDLWKTESDIQQLADELLAEARTYVAYQQQVAELELSLEEKIISRAITQHFEFRKRILVDGVTEIPEMDSALLNDEVRHKKLVDADSLKRVDSEYRITEIILQEDGTADALVTETVYYEIDDETLWDPTTDEIIVHMIHLADVDGNCRVIRDAYREKYTNFNSRTFNAYPLEQAQKRIVTEAVAQYFSFKKDILCDGITVIPKMHPLQLKDELAHKQMLDDADIQWIDSTYVIQEIKLWDREYADVTLTETVTYMVNGETKQEVIQHNIVVVGVQFSAYVIADGYFEPFSGFRSASYVDPSELPN